MRSVEQTLCEGDCHSRRQTDPRFDSSNNPEERAAKYLYDSKTAGLLMDCKYEQPCCDKSVLLFHRVAYDFKPKVRTVVECIGFPGSTRVVGN
jgi:hypothetical protein